MLTVPAHLHSWTLANLVIAVIPSLGQRAVSACFLPHYHQTLSAMKEEHRISGISSESVYHYLVLP